MRRTPNRNPSLYKNQLTDASGTVFAAALETNTTLTTLESVLPFHMPLCMLLLLRTLLLSTLCAGCACAAASCSLVLLLYPVCASTASCASVLTDAVCCSSPLLSSFPPACWVGGVVWAPNRNSSLRSNQLTDASKTTIRDAWGNRSEGLYL